MSGTTENESLVGLINQLAEVPTPAPVSMAPQTPGWAILAALIAVGLFWLARRYWISHKANAYRRAALKALNSAGNDPAAVSAILKRTALAAYGRAEVAALTGSEWLDFLNRTSGKFVGDTGTAIVSAAYAKSPIQAPDLNHQARHWVAHHPPSPETRDD
ncbi:uncharacterized protein DUF4381 [Shimia isoporae]|uniref:Uncharacterized protein DUF4381 n=1 Tax=Shimia isoporae TaxID=647720 RepID=A0A4R1N2X6_9RHOB|nr:DUF4381 domain-containing protein [Shimia isoporae]TCL00760.1 uncharacterized protein DUF4381 [Shimia isoporae]